jgi:predicted acyltransferase
MSLDVFRGATIAAMMLVNNPGDWKEVYTPLRHAEWHGWTFTDLVFPFFLWIVGVAIPLSTIRRLEAGQGRRTLWLHALRRAAILCGLGLFLSSFGYFIDGSLFRDGFATWLHTYATNVRIPGVLQRIAVCYAVATSIFLLTESLAGPAAVMSGGCKLQAAIIAALLGTGWLLMTVVPVPGYGAGVLEKEGNLAQYVDNLLFNGPVIGSHVWKSAKTWDPEGIVSTIPAIATCLFGVLAGQLLRSRLGPNKKTVWLLAAGALLVECGELMSLWLPINKSLWTSSYSVLMAGMASALFAVCYWVIDVRGWQRWSKPLAIYGMNAITVFVLAGVLGRLSLEVKMATVAGETVALKTYLYGNLFAPFSSPDTAPFLSFLASPKNASLAWALTHVALLYGVAYFMYRRKWFVKF